MSGPGLRSDGSAQGGARIGEVFHRRRSGIRVGRSQPAVLTGEPLGVGRCSRRVGSGRRQFAGVQAALDDATVTLVRTVAPSRQLGRDGVAVGDRPEKITSTRPGGPQQTPGQRHSGHQFGVRVGRRRDLSPNARRAGGSLEEDIRTRHGLVAEQVGDGGTEVSALSRPGVVKPGDFRRMTSVSIAARSSRQA